MHNRDDRLSILGAVARGAVAGAIATWVMGKATSYLYEHEAHPARTAEDQARAGKTSYGVAAEKIANISGITLSKPQREKYGSAIHWGLGIATAAAYAAFRNRLPDVGPARGLLFGTAFWLLMDEGAVYALGLTPGPTKFPWQTHARGLAGHLVFGTVTDSALATLSMH
jgi:hypothetical protein